MLLYTVSQMCEKARIVNADPCHSWLNIERVLFNCEKCDQCCKRNVCNSYMVHMDMVHMDMEHMDLMNMDMVDMEFKQDPLIVLDYCSVEACQHV